MYATHIPDHFYVCDDRGGASFNRVSGATTTPHRSVKMRSELKSKALDLPCWTAGWVVDRKSPLDAAPSRGRISVGVDPDCLPMTATHRDPVSCLECHVFTRRGTE